MASTSGGMSHKNTGFSDAISKLINDHHISLVPVVNLADDDTVNNCNMDTDPYNAVNDDELDDLLEEQSLLSRIKEMENARYNLAIHRTPAVKVDNTFDNSGNYGSSVDMPDDDNDSILDFLNDEETHDEGGKVKEELFKVMKALTLNVVMRSQLNKFEVYLVDFLKKNHRKQTELRDAIERQSQDLKKTVNQRTNNCVRFGMPYFKDGKRFSCPLNADCKRMAMVGQILSINFNYSRMWSLKDKILLESGIKKVLVEEETDKYRENMALLKEELQDNCTVERRKEIIELLKNLGEQIDTYKNNSLAVLFSKGSPDREFDWLHLSTVCVPHHSAVECQRMWHLYTKPTVNKRAWTAKEDRRLLDIVKNQGAEDWDRVAKRLGTARTGYQCFITYQNRLNGNLRKTGKWAPEEDEQLVTLVDKCRVGNYIPWSKIAYYTHGRSLPQIYGRWTTSINPKLKKGRFTKYEDRLIVAFVRKYGEDFHKISKLFGDRSSCQLRERYTRSLPEKYRNTGRWSLEEDELLLSLVKQYGTKDWSSLSKRFVTRTRTQIRQRHHAIMSHFKRNPDFEIKNLYRGPNAKSQNKLLISVSSGTSRGSKAKLLSEIVHEDKENDLSLNKEKELLITKIRKGRKRIFKRNEVDTNLLRYFREVYTNDKLQLKTCFRKPDMDKAAETMLLFCRFLQTHLVLPDGNQDNFKKLPNTLRTLIETMKEKYTNWGCDCLVIDQPQSSSNSCVCLELNSIDCAPVKRESTVVESKVFMLGFLPQYQRPLTVKGRTCECYEDRTKHFIPYYMPPNILTAIGFRSVLLMKDKISISLSYDRKRVGYFCINDTEIQSNNLKRFNGFFSNESESESSEDEPSVEQNHTDNSIYNNAQLSLPSTSKDSARVIPSTSTGNDRVLLTDIQSSQADVAPQTHAPNKRLTQQDAINLWKERLIALLGWPTVLSTQHINCSNMNLKKDNPHKKVDSRRPTKQRKSSSNLKGASNNGIQKHNRIQIRLEDNEVIKTTPVNNYKEEKKEYQLFEDALSDDEYSKENNSDRDIEDMYSELQLDGSSNIGSNNVSKKVKRSCRTQKLLSNDSNSETTKMSGSVKVNVSANKKVYKCYSNNNKK